MKRLRLPLLPLLLSVGSCAPQHPPSTWRTSMADATRTAAREGKGVLLLQLFGRYDDEFC